MDQKRRPRSLLILTALILLLNLIIPVSALAADTEPLPEHPDATVMQEGEIEELVRSVLEEYNVDESTVTVGFCYTATGECGYYNAGAYIYSASLYKLPLMMYFTWSGCSAAS